MSRLLAVAAAAGAIAVVAIGVAVDPEQPFAVPGMVVALAVFSGALVGVVQLATAADARGRTPRGGAARALRRAVEAGAVVGLLLALRVIDGLTVITGGFVVVAFVAAEVILSARTGRASR